MSLASTTVTGQGLTIGFTDTDDWGSGFIGGVKISNGSANAINGWTITFTLANTITNIWNAQIVSHIGDQYVISSLPYDGGIAPSQSVSFGFQASGGNPTLPTSSVFNGASLSNSAAPPMPSLSVADASVTETTAASLNETFTVTLSAAATKPVTVAYTTEDGTAKAGTDYTATSGTLTFAPGTTSETITVATHPGTPGTERYSLALSAPAGAVISQGTATGTIVNPTPVTLPDITADNATVQETTTTGTGSTLLPSGFLSTNGNQIVSDTGTPVKIAAINWYGFETNSYAPQGLWAQSYKTMMNQMVQLGFNTIRLPFSLQLFDPGSTPNGINYTLNPDLVGLDGLQIMDKIVAYAGQIGLKIILDDHRSAAGSGPNDNGLWYDGGYTQADWISTWQMLATHYAGNSTIIGADLSNEPHGAATWGDGSATDWEAAATTAGDAIQSVNPNWLMFVEGIQTYDGESTWWGGNLMGVAAHPVVLTDPNKVVYSPHDYPASVYPQSWFSAANYPNNLPSVWSQNWGYIYQDGLAPVFLGEFGSKLQTTSDQQWIKQLVSYLDAPGGVGGAQGVSWAYWDWNPTSGDTGGILENDWSTVDTTKMAAIEPALYHAGSGTTVSPATVDFALHLSKASTSPVTLHYATKDGTAKAGINYVAESGTVTFAPGTTTAIVAADLLGSQATDASLTFMLALSNPMGASLSNTTATATLIPASVGTGTGGNSSGESGTASGGGAGGTTTPTSPIVLVTPKVTQSWAGGFIDTVSVANSGSQALNGWEVEIKTPAVITNLWNAVTLSHTGNTYVLGNASYNGAVAAGGSASFGFQADGASTAPLTAIFHSN